MILERQFTIIPTEIADREDLTLYEKAVYFQIARYKGMVMPPINEVAKNAGMSIRQFKKSYESLLNKVGKLD